VALMRFFDNLLAWLVDYLIPPKFSFRSDRLAYHPLHRDEVPAVCSLITLACVTEMSPDGRDLRDPMIFRGAQTCWYVARCGDEIVGFIGFRGGSFGFWIAPQHRRRGYASEMVGAFMTHPVFASVMQSAGCFEDNVASRKILERSNLVEDKRMPLQSRLLPEPRMAVFFARP